MLIFLGINTGIHFNLNTRDMKKMSRLKLIQLNKAELDDRQMNRILGACWCKCDGSGAGVCACGCWGSSTTDTNCDANAGAGYGQSSGGGNHTCGCCSTDCMYNTSNA